jgi:hypothetical protein
MFLTLFERAQSLFEPLQWRMYLASVVTRNGLRNPFGSRRSMPLQANRPTLIAKNDSKARALAVNIQMFTIAPVRFAQSPDIGNTELLLDPNNDPTLVDGAQFLLAPSEQLYAQPDAAQPDAAQFVVVGQEWF